MSYIVIQILWKNTAYNVTPRVLFFRFCNVFFAFASNPKSQSIPQYIKNIPFG